MHWLNWLLTLLLVLTGLMVVRRVALGRRSQSAPRPVEREQDDERRTQRLSSTEQGEVAPSMLGERLRPSPPTVLRDPDAVEALVRAGDLASAMRAYLAQTGASKLEARLAVERIRARLAG